MSLPLLALWLIVTLLAGVLEAASDGLGFTWAGDTAEDWA